jgi:hypothetical protein
LGKRRQAIPYKHCNRDFVSGYEKSSNASPVMSKSKDTCISILYSYENYMSKGKEKGDRGTPLRGPSVVFLFHERSTHSTQQLN